MSRVWISRFLALKQKCLGVFYQFLNPYKKLHGLATIHDAMIIGERDVHHWSDRDLTIDNDRSLLNFMHAKDAHLRRI